MYSMRLGKPRNGCIIAPLFTFWGTTVTYTAADESPLLDAQKHLNYIYLKRLNKTKNINSSSQERTINTNK